MIEEVAVDETSPAQIAASIRAAERMGIALDTEHAVAVINTARRTLRGGGPPVLAINAAAAVLFPGAVGDPDADVATLMAQTMNVVWAADQLAPFGVLPIELRRT